jgi:hypothetical protein
MVPTVAALRLDVVSAEESVSITDSLQLTAKIIKKKP